MKTTRFYVIVVEHIKSQTAKVSQEAYFDYEEAKSFIESRSDKPEQVSPFKFESAEYRYTINDVFANRKEGN